jgi:hypothetical protein
VDVEEFVTAMDKLTFHVKDSHLLDNLIASMLEGRKVGAPQRGMSQLSGGDTPSVATKARRFLISDLVLPLMCLPPQTGNLALAVDPLDEVEPFKLQELCRMLPALEHVLQVGGCAM